MHQDVEKIFRDAGATEGAIGAIDEIIRATAMEARGVVIAASSLVRAELQLLLRVLLCRVIHADMEKMFKMSRTADETPG